MDGQNFSEWFVNGYMVSAATLLHKNPRTGESQPIGLGWLDDSMTSKGPTEVACMALIFVFGCGVGVEGGAEGKDG